MIDITDQFKLVCTQLPPVEPFHAQKKEAIPAGLENAYAEFHQLVNTVFLQLTLYSKKLAEYTQDLQKRHMQPSSTFASTFHAFQKECMEGIDQLRFFLDAFKSHRRGLLRLTDSSLTDQYGHHCAMVLVLTDQFRALTRAYYNLQDTAMKRKKQRQIDLSLYDEIGKDREPMKDREKPVMGIIDDKASRKIENFKTDALKNFNEFSNFLVSSFVGEEEKKKRKEIKIEADKKAIDAAKASTSNNAFARHPPASSSTATATMSNIVMNDRREKISQDTSWRSSTQFNPMMEDDIPMTAQMQVQLQEENAVLQSTFEFMFDEVKKTEKAIYAIADLQRVFEQHVTQQAHQIEKLYTEAITSSEHVSQGNRHLRQANAYSASFRRMLTAFFVVAGLLLLFLDHFYS